MEYIENEIIMTGMVEGFDAKLRLVCCLPTPYATDVCLMSSILSAKSI